jgi:hypothetical protein
MTRYIVKLINTETRRYTAVFVSAKSAAEAETAALAGEVTYNAAQAKVA